ncbi:hypothetical protein DRQ53_14180, partial [bacterium]
VTGGPFTITAVGPFYAPTVVYGEIPKTPDPAERQVDVGDIVLEPIAGKVTGTVYMPDGETPVGGNVLVKIRSISSKGEIIVPDAGGGSIPQPILPEIDVITDQNGQFEFPLVLSGRFAIEADTGVPDPANTAQTAAEMRTDAFEDSEGNRILNVRLFGEAGGSVPSGGEIAIDLRLYDAGAVEVRVVDIDGVTPIQQAEVTLETKSVLDNDSIGETFTKQLANNDGFIEFFPVIEGAYSIRVQEPSSPRGALAAGSMPVNPDNGLVLVHKLILGTVTTRSGEIRLVDYFGTVDGTVFNSDGSVLTRPTLITVTSEGAEFLANSDESGHFVAEFVPGGLFLVEAIEPYTAKRGSATGAISFEGDIASVDINLTGLGTVQGQVFSNDGGTVLAGVDVILRPSGNYSRDIATRTNAYGVYSVSGVPLGPYLVTAKDNETKLGGSATGIVPEDLAEVTTDIYMQSSGGLTGIVYAAGTLLNTDGIPVDATGAELDNPPTVTNAVIRLYQCCSSRRPDFDRVVQSNAAGEFAFGDFIPEGTYTLIATTVNGGDGMETKISVEYQGHAPYAPLVFDGIGDVAGIVLDSSGLSPVDKALVTIHSRSQFSKGAITRITGSDGVFEFTDIPVGQYSISANTTLSAVELGATVSDSIGENGTSIGYFEDDGDPDRGAIRLEDAGIIRGQVLAPDTESFASGAVVEIRGPSPNGIRSARVADAMGLFEFKAIPLDDYRLTVIDPASGGTAVREFSLDANGLIIELGQIEVDNSAPYVIETYPAPDAAGVHSRDFITVTFSELIDTSTIDDQSIVVRIQGNPIPGLIEVTDSGLSLIYTPGSPLPDLQLVSVTVRGDKIGFEGQVLENGIKDLSGIGLQGNYEFSFTTSDATPPSLESVSPRVGATDVPLESVIRFAFSEPITPASVQTLTLTENGNPVDGNIAFPSALGGSVVVFTPSVNLQPNSVYTVELVGPVTDLVGNPMDQESLQVGFTSLDTIPPVIVTVGFPPAEGIIEGATIELVPEFGASEDIVRVEYYLNGELLAQVDTPPFTYDLTLTSELGESATISVVAVDAVGLRSDAGAQEFTINPDQPPVVSIGSLSHQEVSPGDEVTFEVAANDDLALDSISYAANSGLVANEYVLLEGVKSEVRVFSFIVPDQLPGNSISLTAGAQDSKGQTTTSAAVELTVIGDQIPPEVAIATVSGKSTVEPGSENLLRVTATDAGGIARISVNASNFLDENRDTGGVEESVEFFTLMVPGDTPAGTEINVVARAVDNLGNETLTDALVLTVQDTSGPQVAILSPADNAPVSIG